MSGQTLSGELKDKCPGDRYGNNKDKRCVLRHDTREPLVNILRCRYCLNFVYSHQTGVKPGPQYAWK